MQAHITSYCLISPQETFFPDRFLHPLQESDEPVLRCLDPDFKSFIPPVQQRRMSHLLKRSLTTGSVCVQNAQITPDAIIVGTGRSCCSDLNSFLRSVVSPDGDSVSPITFVNSSHNTVAAQLSLKMGNTGYNTTYCHRGLSFESALEDAMMLFNEGIAGSVLTGALDEFSDTSFRWDGASDQWKKTKISSLKLLQSGTPGTICGEGVGFFMLEANISPRVKATIKGVSMRVGQDFPSIQADMMRELSSQTGAAIPQIDVALVGSNGDSRQDPVYNHFIRKYLSGTTTVAAYKHLCGEYMTASGFALWLGCYILEKQFVPEVCITRKGNQTSLRTILLYNHYGSAEHSLILLTLS